MTVKTISPQLEETKYVKIEGDAIHILRIDDEIIMYSSNFEIKIVAYPVICEEENNIFSNFL